MALTEQSILTVPTEHEDTSMDAAVATDTTRELAGHDDPADGPALRAGAGPHRRPPARPPQTRSGGGFWRDWRRLTGLACLIAGVLMVLVAVWVAVTATMAKHELTTVKSQLDVLKHQVTSGDVAGAQVTALDIERHAHRAHELTTGPAWALAAAVPGAGAPLHTARGISTAVDDLAGSAVPDFTHVAAGLDPHTLHKGNTFNVAAITAAQPALARAADALRQTANAVSALPAHTWLGSVDAARSELATKLTDLANGTASLDDAARVVPAMLGADGPRRYFVGFMNEAEMRGLGGLPGAFGIVVADHGTLTFTHFEPDNTLVGVDSGLHFGAEYDARNGAALSTSLYNDSTLNPNFPYAAQIWAAMWQKYSGEHIDGAIAVDPTALAYVLRVIGPVTLPDGTLIDANTVVPETESRAYAIYHAANDARKLYLLEVAQAVQKKLFTGAGDSTALGRAVLKAGRDRRLLIWSAHPDDEAYLARTTVSGVIPTGPGPFTGFTVDNAAGNKLDFYLDRTLRYQRTGCGQTRTATVTVILTNTAPASGLSSYVTGRLDHPAYPVQVGDSSALVSVYATAGATLTGATLDGKPIAMGAATESGHPVFAVGVELPRTVTQTLVLHLQEPAVDGTVTVLRQPGVRPLVTDIADEPVCTR